MRYLPVTAGPASGGQLMPGLSNDTAGLNNYVKKRDWRRDRDAEIVREGEDVFAPNRFVDIGTQPLFAGEPITLVAELRAPNGQHAVIVGTATKIWRYFGVENASYVSGVASGSGTTTADVEIGANEVVASDPFFSEAMVGQVILFSGGFAATVTAFTDSTHVDIDTAPGDVVAGQTFEIGAIFYFAQAGPYTPYVAPTGEGTPYVLEGGQSASGYVSDDPQYYPDGDPRYWLDSHANWVQIAGTGVGVPISSGANRWEWEQSNGTTLFNNGVDLPLLYRLDWAKCRPAYELRELGVARVGTIAQIHGIASAFDIAEISEERLVEIMAPIDSGTDGEQLGGLDSSSLGLTGSIAALSTTVVSSGNIFTVDHVGLKMRWHNGEISTIIAFSNATHVTVDNAPEDGIPSMSFLIFNPGGIWSGTTVGTIGSGDKTLNTTADIFTLAHVGKLIEFQNGFLSRIASWNDADSVELVNAPEAGLTSKKFRIYDGTTLGDDIVEADDDYFTDEMVGLLLFFDSGEIREILEVIDGTHARLNDYTGIASTGFSLQNAQAYAAFNEPENESRIGWRHIWTMPGQISKWGASVPASIVLETRELRFDYPMASLEVGRVVTITGVGTNGGNLTATIVYVQEGAMSALISLPSEGAAGLETAQRGRLDGTAILTIPNHGLRDGDLVDVRFQSSTSYDETNVEIAVIDDDHISYANSGSDEATVADDQGTVTRRDARTEVEGADVAGSIIGYEDLADDSGFVIRALPLRGVLVIYRDNSILEARYTGTAAEPWEYRRIYSGEKTPMHRWTLVAVLGLYHLYAGRNSIYRFDLVNQRPMEVPAQEWIREEFFSHATPDNTHQVFAVDNALTKEVFFCYPSSDAETGLAYDYLQDTWSQLGSQYSGAATLRRPRLGGLTGPSEQWFVAANSIGTLLQYGKADVPQSHWNNQTALYTRSGAQYEAVLESGMGGDGFTEHTLERHVTRLASRSGRKAEQAAKGSTIIDWNNESVAGVEYPLANILHNMELGTVGGTFTKAVPPQTTVDPPVSHWTLDEPFSVFHDDLGPNEFTEGNALGGVAGQFNSAVSFDGTQYLRCPVPTGLDFGDNPATITGWFKTDVAQAYGTIISKGMPIATPTNHYDFEVFVWQDGPNLRITFYIESNSSFAQVDYTVPVTLGVWHFFAAGYDKANGRIFLRLDNGAEQTAVWAVGFRDTGGNLVLGAAPDFSGTFFTGAIDEVGIYDRKLSDAEMDALFDPEEPAPILPVALVEGIHFTVNRTTGKVTFFDVDPLTGEVGTIELTYDYTITDEVETQARAIRDTLEVTLGVGKWFNFGRKFTRRQKLHETWVDYSQNAEVLFLNNGDKAIVPQVDPDTLDCIWKFKADSGLEATDYKIFKRFRGFSYQSTVAIDKTASEWEEIEAPFSLIEIEDGVVTFRVYEFAAVNNGDGVYDVKFVCSLGRVPSSQYTVMDNGLIIIRPRTPSKILKSGTVTGVNNRGIGGTEDHLLSSGGGLAAMPVGSYAVGNYNSLGESWPISMVEEVVSNFDLIVHNGLAFDDPGEGYAIYDFPPTREYHYELRFDQPHITTPLKVEILRTRNPAEEPVAVCERWFTNPDEECLLPTAFIGHYFGDRITALSAPIALKARCFSLAGGKGESFVRRVDQ